jgi:hypothetical protein
MRRYIEAAAWKVKERVDEEGSTREERDTKQRVVPWSGGCEHEETRTEAQWNCGSQTTAIRCVDQASQIYQGQREEGYTHVDPANVLGRRVCAMPVLLT